MAKKKASKKEGKFYANIGRPKGAKAYVPKGLEIREAKPLSRENAVVKQKGLRRLVLETRQEDKALQLAKLATLIRKRDKSLMALIN